ncbi:metallophosphoesterase [Paraburkholderia domus]|uniref:metallophosphoesterase n=1 Tax=Paraburkholderia domus TaxID=2793075 RepID=UPI001912B901|nr:metallophosphoesterase [Paraburkholderia domus]MBK5061847.1 metallophosphoesterase [Burkholderia sp. R-70199]CAE6901573.1 Serine/threonine-protein phosphatase 2 [Paraburkholderia domus]
MNPVKHFGRNALGRDYAVGDIHSCVSKLKTALRAIGFDAARDRLFAVGDLVDRGQENDEAIELLEQPWFHSVLGNHEQMAILFAHGELAAGFYVQCGGGWNIANPQARRIEIADAFSALPIAMEVETANGLIGIVHADYPLRRWQDIHAALAGADREQHLKCMLWSRDRFDQENRDEVEGVRAVIVGHTPLVLYSSLGNTIYIDTGAWIARENRPFTILDLETLRPVHQPSPGLWT